MDTPARQSDRRDSDIRVILLTPGPRDANSGGHRYNDHLAAAAPAHGFVMRTEPASFARLPSADAVIIDSLEAWKVAAAVRRTSRPRTVALVHQQPGGVDGSRFLRWIRRALDIAAYRRCDLVVASGPAVADMLRGVGLDPGRVEVIEPGSDVPPLHERPPLRAGYRIGVLNVANWLPNKGIAELVDAVSALPRDDVVLHLAGQTDVVPDYEVEVRTRLHRADLADRVVVHGALDPAAIGSLYAAADVFVFPSHAEAYGTVVAEALAMGLPVVGWRTPYMCALVEDHIEGLLVPPGDIAGLSDALHRLAIDAELRTELGDGARRRGARLPTWEQITNRFFCALSRVLAEAVEPPDERTAADHIDPTD